MGAGINRCYLCDGTELLEEATMRSKTVHICYECLHNDEIFYRCKWCKKIWEEEDIQYVEAEGGYVCHECLSDSYEYGRCELCWKYVDENELREYTICEGCRYTVKDTFLFEKEYLEE